MAIEKSKAEQYRDERKARIAEAAKKNAKDMQKKNATKKIAKRVVSIVLVAAIAIGAVAVALNYYGVWDRTLRAGYVGAEDKFSMAEYEYHYWATYNTLLSEVSNSYSTGVNYNYDTNLPPDKQTSTAEDEKGNPISWVEFIRKQTLDDIKIYNIYYNEAVKLGIDTLTEAEEKQIDETVESMREQANGSATTDGAAKPKYTLNAYLRMNFGAYMNESFLRKIMEKEIIAQKFIEYKLDEIAKSYDQADIDAEYNKDKSSFDLVDVRLYEFAKTTLQAETGESDAALKKRQAEADEKVKKDADAFFAAVTDEASFLAKAKELNKDAKDYDADAATKLSGMLKSELTNVAKDLAEWAFKAETKVGEKKMVTSADGSKYYVVVLTAKPYQVETVSVRHILLGNTNAETGEKLSDDEIAQKEKDAKAILDEWAKGDKSEDSFAALATEKTEDTGSAQTGGLYENVRPGRMVTEFDKWIFDKNRKAGDTDIVETEYGYHVMYFVSNDGKYYDATIRNSKAQIDLQAELDELVESETYKLTYGPRTVEYAEKKLNERIATIIAQQAAQQSYAPQY